jgi:hypothetical protein
MYMQDIFQHTLKALDQRDPSSTGGQHGRKSAQSGAQIELPAEDSTHDDAGTAGVVSSDYDGAPYCSHCGAKGAQWCSCGPIAETE